MLDRSRGVAFIVSAEHVVDAGGIMDVEVTATRQVLDDVPQAWEQSVIASIAGGSSGGAEYKPSQRLGSSGISKEAGFAFLII